MCACSRSREPATRVPQHAGCCGRRRSCCRPTRSCELYDGPQTSPPYNEDDGSEPPLRGGARACAGDRGRRGPDRTPEYNSSIPGQLKNALDWASRPFPDNALRNKPVAVIGASTGMFGAVWAQGEVRKVLRRIGADVVDRELPVAFAHERLDADGRLTDDLLRQELSDLLGELVAGARRGPLAGEPPIALAS